MKIIISALLFYVFKYLLCASIFSLDQRRRNQIGNSDRVTLYDLFDLIIARPHPLENRDILMT